MAAIVLELQKEALSKQVPITDLLRKAMFVAKKLKVHEFEKWIQIELNGYDDYTQEQIPKYRQLRGTPKVWNPYHGWQTIMFQNVEVGHALSIRSCYQPIAEIEHMLDMQSPDGHFEMQYPGQTEHDIMQSIGLDLRPSLHVSSAAISKIVDSVRNVVLDWALKLEEDGILGSDVSFSLDEINRAVNANYTINNINGDIINSQFQQNSPEGTLSVTYGVDKKSIESLLKTVQDNISSIAITENKKSDIDAEIATIKSQLISSQPKLIIVREALKSLKDFLISAGANLAASAVQNYLISQGLFPK